MTGGAQISL